MTHVRVHREDCDLNMISDDEEPPRREVRYRESQKKSEKVVRRISSE